MVVTSQKLMLVALPALTVANSFNLWPILDSASLASVLNVSQTCVEAMNATVLCDPDTFRMAGQIDLYYWNGDNITTLCTQSCVSSTTAWISGVYDNCDPSDTIYLDTKLVPIDTVAIRFTDGLGLACLTDQDLQIQFNSGNSTNSTAKDDTTASTLSSSLSGTSMSLQSTTTDPANNTTPDPNITYAYNYSPAPKFCFNQSQNWVGIDIPHCDSDPDNSLCSDPAEGMRIANYYNDSILCSPCFLSVFWWRINSPYLPDTDYSDYLVEQFQDIQDVCNATLPETLLRISPPGYQLGLTPNYTLPSSTTPDNSTVSSVCLGQTLTSSGDPCDTLSDTYGVTTGDLRAASGTDDCSFAGPICVPASCNLAQLGTNATCNTFAASLSSSSLNITDNLLLSWNPNIQGLCDNLTEGQYVCTGPPGGTYVLPPPIGNDTSAAGQQRGGQGSGANPDGPLGPQGPTTNSTAQAPTQPGINPNCTLFAYAAANDTCHDFSVAFSITLELLTLWNPVLGYPDGVNCTTEFWAGYDYCVQVNGTNGFPTSTESSMAGTTSDLTSSLPYPTQSGIDPACNSYAEAVSDDYCSSFAREHNITTEELYHWNQSLGPNGSKCLTQFQAGYNYCVGVSTTASAPPITSSPTSVNPTTTSSTFLPTQGGIAPDCDKLVEAEKGDYCYEFAQTNHITIGELSEWNPILGPNGANCSTEFRAGYGYCVAVSD